MRHAIERGLPFAVSIEEAWDLFVAQEKRCALSGVELTMGRYRPPCRPEGRFERLGTASLDRIDSSKGYVSGNVQWVHKEVNRMKGALPEAEFVRLCASVAAHCANQQPARA